MNTTPASTAYAKLQTLLVTERDLDKCYLAARDTSPLFGTLRNAGLTSDEAHELRERANSLLNELRQLSAKVSTMRIDAEIDLVATLK
jgi:hypothetical protein